MVKAVTEVRQSAATAGTDAIYRSLFDSFNPDSGDRISFTQFRDLARHNSSLIRRAVEGSLAVPDFAALTADITRMYDELLPVRSGAVADYILAAGADPQPTDRWGGTPVSDAEANGHTEITALLREHAGGAAGLRRSGKREEVAV